ncbi:MAG: hypothetical protein QW324_08965 [Thermofilaceae archaeon]
MAAAWKEEVKKEEVLERMRQVRELILRYVDPPDDARYAERVYISIYPKYARLSARECVDAAERAVAEAESVRWIHRLDYYLRAYALLHIAYEKLQEAEADNP